MGPQGRPFAAYLLCTFLLRRTWGSSEPPDLMHSSESSSWAPLGHQERDGAPGGAVHVTPKKRDSKTAIRSPFVHSACRRHGLQYRHGGQLECGQWRGQRAGAFARAAGSPTGLTSALFDGRMTGSIREGWMTASGPRRCAELALLS